MAKIVVMDDEEAVRSAITRVLQRAGHEVLAFENAPIFLLWQVVRVLEGRVTVVIEKRVTYSVDASLLQKVEVSQRPN